MSRIKIKNFGPIREGFVENDGWIDINKVTVFIGDQGSGKSTVAKLISIFLWIEKDLFRTGGLSLTFRQNEGTFKHLLEYHRINDYVNEKTEIQYEGEAYNITYRAGQNPEIQKISDNNYTLPKITYFPAERNFVSSVKNVNGGAYIQLWSRSLQDFKEIYQEAKVNIKEKELFHLPIANVDIEYNGQNDILYVKGNGYKLPLSDTASGFQSFIPLFVVANYVSGLLKSGEEMREDYREYFKNESAKILNNKDYTEEQKRILLSNLAAQFNIKRILNIVEEPEQNLFPTSQQKALHNLLEHNNAVKENKLIISTHSPYILSSLNNSILAEEVFEKTGKEIGNYSKEKRVAFADISAYKFEDGKIFSIKDEESKLINADAIDSCSDNINSDFDELLDLLPVNDD
jgi:predicted ATPase